MKFLSRYQAYPLQIEHTQILLKLTLHNSTLQITRAQISKFKINTLHICMHRERSRSSGLYCRHPVHEIQTVFTERQDNRILIIFQTFHHEKP